MSCHVAGGTQYSAPLRQPTGLAIASLPASRCSNFWLFQRMKLRTRSITVSGLIVHLNAQSQMPRFPLSPRHQWSCLQLPSSGRASIGPRPTCRLAKALAWPIAICFCVSRASQITPGSGDRCGRRCSRIPTAAAIGPRDNLEQMTIWILEVDAASTVMVVNLACLGARGIAPIWEPLLSHPTKDLVDLRFANQKGIVLHRDVAILVHEIDAYAVAGGHHLKWPPLIGCGQAQHLRKKARRCFAIVRPYDGVVEFDCHPMLPLPLVAFRRALRTRPVI